MVLEVHERNEQKLDTNLATEQVQNLGVVILELRVLEHHDFEVSEFLFAEGRV